MTRIRKKWSCIILSADARRRVRKWELPGIVIAAGGIICLASLFGLGRMLYVAGSFGYAKLGVRNERRTNRILLGKLRFLQKLTQQEEQAIEHLVALEDNIRLQFGMKSISEDVRQAGTGGKPEPAAVLLASLEDPPVQFADSIKESISRLTRRARLQDTTFSRVMKFVTTKHNLWAQRPTIWPVRGAKPSRITSHFGYRMHPFTGVTTLHEGLDLANDLWTPIVATGDGIVSYSRNQRYFGNVIKIDHPGTGFQTVYAHLQKAAVEVGQVVHRNEIIGYLGNSGRSTGPHLHYEIRKWKRPVNPLDYILPNELVVD